MKNSPSSAPLAGKAVPAGEGKLAASHSPHQSFWLWVMCLTGVDYFSTLGYQPSIAFKATGILAPLATVVLILVTLLGALPVYAYVAGQSPHGQGSIAMLERLVRGWWGKFLVLVLLGFAATDFVITKTLSAADAATHLIENPFWGNTPQVFQNQMAVTVLLLVLLGAMFMRGFREVIGMAVVLVLGYLLLNALVIGSGLWHLATHREVLAEWYRHVVSGQWNLAHAPVAGHGWGSILVVCLLLFPKLALGLSGFETGIAVMPLVQGDPADSPARPRQRIRNTRKLLLTSALIMSVYLLGSAMVTSTLIPPNDLVHAGRADDRALAYLAHAEGGPVINPLFGQWFGTVYDVATVLILWFAGASAMSGLLNLVPQYLPRYGMAPEWARAFRPLVLLFTAINLLVTWAFKANVNAQSGAYATGVLVLISSAGVATVIDRWRQGRGFWLFRMPWAFVLITVVFVYTTGAIMVEKPEGLKIASCFITAIVLSSMVSRTFRAAELRFVRFDFVDDQSRFLWDSLKHLEFPVLVPHRPGSRPLLSKEKAIQERHRLPPDVPIVYIEAELGDPSDFLQAPLMEVKEETGRFVIRVTRCASISHVIATIGLELSKVGKPPEIHFGWSDEGALEANLRFVLFGEGNIPWKVRELIRRAQPDPERQPNVVVG